ncbi:MAG: FUSC family protein [Clostridia bacterium]|nr:FUSC family protein [Clostridia bacterium]
MSHRISKSIFEQLYFPPLGQRIIKTSFAVFLCLVFYRLRGYRGETMSAEAAITAIICMQPYVQDTKEYALNRLSGTLIGAFWGFLFLLLVPIFPEIGRNPFILYPLMGLGTLISLYSSVVIRKPDTSSLAAIVFVCVVIAYPDIENPLDQAFHRVLDVMVGMGIAIGVNVFRLPRVKQKDKVFFVRTSDLASDQLARIPSSALFRLNYLYNDGAKICLMSEHAPAFFMSQMSSVNLSVPMIVMDGAGIYDPNENTYVSTVNLDPDSSRWLMKRLDTLETSYFIYTVHKNRNCIYHRGRLTDAEAIVYQRMKRSPYRQYLDDDHFALEDVVYIKVVATGDKAAKLQTALGPSLAHRKLRIAIRPQAGLTDGSSLYFYAANADMAHAQDRLMRLLQKKEPELQPVEIFSKNGYRSEHDAAHLLHTLGNSYEPFRPFFWIDPESEKDPRRLR